MTNEYVGVVERVFVLPHELAEGRLIRHHFLRDVVNSHRAGADDALGSIRLSIFQ
jgi:hypothetical protein